jgi:hypothetical protein
MDIDAALKDGYSLAEVNAEAARRVGFNYQNAIKDGYTDDEIVQELRKRLSGSSKIKLVMWLLVLGQKWLKNKRLSKALSRVFLTT